jgi:ketosteroid isomerase-like protein
VPSTHVELAKEGLEAFNRRDVEGMLATLDPEVELVPLRAILQGERYRGYEQFKSYLTGLAEDWDEFTVAPDEFRELDSERVLILGTIHARGRGSGVEVNYPAAWITTVRGGKVVRMHFYNDEAHAIESSPPG